MNLFEKFRDAVLNPTPPPRYRVGEGGFELLPVAPNRVLLFGAPPGTGKTALVMQIGFDAIRIDPKLRLLVCNIEMSPIELLTRELARLSAVPLKTIQDRSYFETPSVDRVKIALDQICSLGDRVRFVEPPYTLENVASTDGGFDAHIVVLDYIQRIPKSSDKSHDSRSQAADSMDMVRRFADCGKAVLVVSSVARDKDYRGKAYSNLNLGSFKESGELEFGADAAYLLEPIDGSADGGMDLKNPKNRYGHRQDIMLRFEPHYQRFTAAERGRYV